MEKFVSPFTNEVKIDQPTMIRVFTDGREFTIVVRDGHVEIAGEFARAITIAPQSDNRLIVQHA